MTRMIFRNGNFGETCVYKTRFLLLIREELDQRLESCLWLYLCLYVYLYLYLHLYLTWCGNFEIPILLELKIHETFEQFNFQKRF